MSEIKTYLRGVVMLLSANNRPFSPGLRYRNVEDFVLQRGRPMGARSPLSDEFPRDPPKQCFGNAYQRMMTGKLVYCEGFATGGILPVQHAWLIDLNCNVIDTTWRTGTEYYGVEFTTEYVVRTVLTRGSYGVIDYFEARWPLLRGEAYA